MSHDSGSEPIIIEARLVTEARPTADDRAQRPSTLAHISELLRAVAWPLLALGFVLLFYAPIRRLIEIVPAKLDKADKANVGYLSWEIQQRVRERGGTELARIVGALSPAAVEELIRIPRHGTMALPGSYSGPNEARGYVIPSSVRSNAFRELRSAELIKFAKPFDDWLNHLALLPVREEKVDPNDGERTIVLATPLTPQQEEGVRQSYELTPKGEQAVQAIVGVIGEQLR